MINEYYQLTKPGIIYGNAFTFLAGFFLASHGNIDVRLLVATLIGLSFIVASGCVINNYVDRDIDALMERTSARALVTGRVSLVCARVFALGLFLLGLVVLIIFANRLAVSASLIGFLVYVVVYTLWLKRRSVHSTLIGGIAGAMPPVVGYLAVSGRFDVGAFLLVCALTIWQMPHFFGIALYRVRDYTNAHIPVMPVVRGAQRTVQEMFAYVLLFTLVALFFYIFGYVGRLFVISVGTVCAVWIWHAWQGFSVKKGGVSSWGRRMFLFSLLTLMVFCFSIFFEYFLKSLGVYV